jgi:hypothetical protein
MTEPEGSDNICPWGTFLRKLGEARETRGLV